MDQIESGCAMTTETSLPETLSFKYVPRPGLLKITFVNLLLSILTLTIYRFWAKTNVRKHIWSCIHINDEPLEYTGRGKELFIGALVVFGCFLLPYILVLNAFEFYGSAGALTASAVLRFGFVLFIYIFWGYAVYKARKYQLSRTLWRGIRGTLVGSAMSYSFTFFGSLLARTVSLGWSTPVMDTILQEKIIGDMRFGDAAFKFKGRAGPLYPTYAFCWFISLIAVVGGTYFILGEIQYIFGDEVKIFLDEFWKNFANAQSNWIDLPKTPTLFLLAFLGFLAIMLFIPMLWALYSAKEICRFADYTRFDGAQFRVNATAGSLIWLTFVNMLLLTFTLGIAWPFITQRNVRYFIDRLSLEGAIDIDRISQSMAALPKRGEGLADAFEIGAW
jgi:uncharacterized membrane protein YjgN (DUF898 family)